MASGDRHAHHGAGPQIAAERGRHGSEAQCRSNLSISAAPRARSRWPRCRWRAAGTALRTSRKPRSWCAKPRRAGAQIILLPELFETPYFCIEQDARHLKLARTVDDNPAVRHFSAVARELGVVLPISFFERAGPAYFNSIAILDADGSRLGHLPQVSHPERARLPGEELLQSRRYGLQGLADAVRAHRGRNLLGSVVSRRRARHGACRVRRYCCIRPPSVPSRRRRCR